jgi:ABC-2 type transport system permease protein
MGSPAVEIIFPSMGYVIFLVTPVITMRLLSEDRRQKVDQALLTAPVSVAGIVLGKFFSALAVYGLALTPTLLFQVIAAMLSEGINWLVFLNALLGALLVGAALVSIGMFISSLTESTIISCILSLVCNLLLMILPTFVRMISTDVTLGGITWLEDLLSKGLTFFVEASDKIALMGLISDFAGSVFHISDVVYLLSIAAVFAFLSIRAVERRRWA